MDPGACRCSTVHAVRILVTGGAGMVGGKLAQRLARDGVARRRADLARCSSSTSWSPSRRLDAGVRGRDGRRRRRRAGRRRPSSCRAGPTSIFHLAAVVSGEAEADFEKGYRVNLDGTRRLLDAIRATRARLPPARRLRLVDRRVRRAVPRGDRRRPVPDAADELRDAEGDRRAAAVRLHPARLPRRRRHPAADDLRSARARPTGRRRGSSRASSASR